MLRSLLGISKFCSTLISHLFSYFFGSYLKTDIKYSNLGQQDNLMQNELIFCNFVFLLYFLNKIQFHCEKIKRYREDFGEKKKKKIKELNLN